jgi:hypothetical protein
MSRRRETPPADGKVTRRAYEEQIHLKMSKGLRDRLGQTAAALETDITNLIRLILAEHLPEYEERARRARGETSPE